MDVEYKWILLQVGYCRQVAIYPVIYQSVHSSSRTGGDGGIVILDGKGKYFSPGPVHAD